ncbi:MAG: CoA transferase [Alphaproteobacteria bacterium]|nr:CoA transferase [Alphaproteobacteria bacterium]
MTQTKPLSGIKVLDLTRVLSGPYCAQMLFDMGAEVLKIENPAWGDDARLFQPYVENRSLYFEFVNGGKKSLTLNLKKPKAAEILKSLIADADVLVENFRPGIMKKFGLDYESVKKINPRLIYASISGFGQTGPDALKPAYDILTQARGGIMSLTGYPEGEPVLIGVSFSDMIAGVFAMTAITTALYQREKTNEGQQIDISMLDCQISLLESSMMRYQKTKVAPKPVGCRHPTEAPFQSFDASDRPFVVAAIGDATFTRFCEILGCPEVSSDPKFNSTAARHENLDELGALLQKIFITKTAAEWVQLLQENSIPVSLIQDLDEVCHDPQVKARHMLIKSEAPELSDIELMATPIKMTSLPEQTSRPAAPLLGQDTIDVLHGLGMNDQQIEELKKEGVV